MLLKTNLLIRPEQFDAALKAIVRHCPDRKLENVTDEALIAAQRDDQLTIEAMCLLAGLTYTDLARGSTGCRQTRTRAGSPRKCEPLSRRSIVSFAAR